MPAAHMRSVPRSSTSVVDLTPEHEAGHAIVGAYYECWITRIEWRGPGDGETKFFEQAPTEAWLRIAIAGDLARDGLDVPLDQWHGLHYGDDLIIVEKCLRRLAGRGKRAQAELQRAATEEVRQVLLDHREAHRNLAALIRERRVLVNIWPQRRLLLEAAARGELGACR